jgi:hypothetical protein
MSNRSVRLSIESLEERALPSVNPVLNPPAGLSAQMSTLSQSVSNQILLEMVPVLQTLNNTLANADRDYDWHRANAVVDISRADLQLGDALNFVGQKTDVDPAPMRTDKGAHPESQKLSDAQLAAEIPVLNMAIKILEHADHDYGGHRVDAIHDLEAAVVQLEKALAYSEAHNQNKK